MSATGTPTPNLGLRIPLGTDPASVDDINYNSNTLDTVIGDIGETPVAGQLGAANNRISAVQAGLAIVCNGNTHAAIESGQFAYVKNHSTLAEGLYRNNTGSTIAANATLSSSNLTADSSGGLNTVYESLNSNITTINSKVDGIEIPANTSLNTLTTPGNYYSPNSTRTATLTDCPVSGQGFSLQVLKRSTSCTQSIIAADGKFYTRGYASGGFTDWTELNHNTVKYGNVNHNAENVTDGTPIEITNSYSSKTCVGVLLKSGGGNGGYAIGYASLNGDKIRFVPKWTDTSVTLSFTVLYV